MEPEVSGRLKCFIRRSIAAACPQQAHRLERLEPYEGKLSRTVLRGVRAGQPARTYPTEMVKFVAVFDHQLPTSRELDRFGSGLGAVLKPVVPCPSLSSVLRATRARGRDGAEKCQKVQESANQLRLAFHSLGGRTALSACGRAKSNSISSSVQCRRVSRFAGTEPLRPTDHLPIFSMFTAFSGSSFTGCPRHALPCAARRSLCWQ